MADLETVHGAIDHTGITGVGGGGTILQIAFGTSTADDTTTTTASLQDTSLSASITPLASDSIILVVATGAAEFSRPAGTIAERRGWLALRNVTNSTTLCEYPIGHDLVATSNIAATVFVNFHIAGRYTVNSTAARTFRLQYRSSVATNSQARINGTRTGGALMILYELAQ